MAALTGLTVDAAEPMDARTRSLVLGKPRSGAVSHSADRHHRRLARGGNQNETPNVDQVTITGSEHRATHLAVQRRFTSDHDPVVRMITMASTD
jgi:hypothetical protein